MLRTQWRPADELTGVIVGSLDELKWKLPKDKKHFGPPYENDDSPPEDVRVYSRDSKLSDWQQNVAYECNKRCKGIVIGPPKIQSYNTIAPLSGKKGVKYTCVRCNSTLHDGVLGWS